MNPDIIQLNYIWIPVWAQLYHIAGMGLWLDFIFCPEHDFPEAE